MPDSDPTSARTRSLLVFVTIFAALTFGRLDAAVFADTNAATHVGLGLESASARGPRIAARGPALRAAHGFPTNPGYVTGAAAAAAAASCFAISLATRGMAASVCFLAMGRSFS